VCAVSWWPIYSTAAAVGEPSKACADDDLEDSRDYFEGDVLGDVIEDDLVNTMPALPPIAEKAARELSRRCLRGNADADFAKTGFSTVTKSMLIALVTRLVNEAGGVASDVEEDDDGGVTNGQARAAGSTDDNNDGVVVAAAAAAADQARRDDIGKMTMEEAHEALFLSQTAPSITQSAAVAATAAGAAASASSQAPSQPSSQLKPVCQVLKKGEVLRRL
jgi:hypothetical protein